MLKKIFFIPVDGADRAGIHHGEADDFRDFLISRIMGEPCGIPADGIMQRAERFEREGAVGNKPFGPEGHCGYGMDHTVAEPVRIIFNDPATIVFWDDGTKTVVKCTKGDTFSTAAGFALCHMKKTMGDEAYRNILKTIYEIEKDLAPAKQASAQEEPAHEAGEEKSEKKPAKRGRPRKSTAQG